jgi:S1-C subfamily serine protease
MAKSLLKILIILVVGAAGGVLADRFLPFLDKDPSAPVYVTEQTETKLYIQENTAVREAVQDVLPAVVGVKTKTVEGQTLLGSGLVLTSDGLIVTLASLVPQGSQFAFFVDGKWSAYQILKRDMVNDLALVKLERSGLKTRGFVDEGKVKLAEPVFLVGTDFSAAVSTTTLPQNIVNTGVISALSKGLIKTNIFDESFLAGSPVFDVEARVVGLATIGENGRVSAIPASVIRTFTGF